jgi:hypothetical protein
MKRRLIITGICLIFGMVTMTEVYSQKSAPLDPMSQGSWIVGCGIGAGTQVWGNGYGFGPGFKAFFENGTFQLGPGVLTLGGEFGFSYFSYTWTYGDLTHREYWLNNLFGARSAYHYSWKVPGLDTYGGIPLGIGFTYNAHSTVLGYLPYHVIYPYLGMFLGTSYFFNNFVGVNGEIGYNVTYANLGVIFKLH